MSKEGDLAAAAAPRRTLPPARSGIWLVIGCAAIVAVQLLVLGAGDSSVFSGSDAGGRAAAVAAAAPGCDHDLGYWASAWDPDGRVHPMVNTERVGNRFVQPASPLFICAAGPLAGAFGISAATWLSIVGVVLAAVGAWSLERFGGGAGILSLLLVGVVGPVAFYGTDVWEHAPAVGLAMAGTALLLGREEGTSWWLGGLAWGLAIALRSETALVACALAVAVLVIGEVRRRLLGRVGRLVLAAAGAAMAVVGDRVVERLVLDGDYRSERTAGQVGGAFEGWTARGRDALTTTIGLLPTADLGVEMVLAAAFVMALVAIGAVLAGADPSPRTVRVLVAIGGVALLAALIDPGFVPGMLTAAPVAVVGLFACAPRVVAPMRVLCIGALLALPAIWALQWTGNLVAQWGSRYQLLSGALLTVCGAVLVGSRLRTFAASAAIAAALTVGTMGLFWHVERTHTISAVLDDVMQVPCDGVLISAQPFLLREGGADEELRSGIRADGCRMLSAAPEEVPFALEVARRADAAEAVVLGRGAIDEVPSVLVGTEVVSHQVVELGGVTHTVFRIDVT